MGERVEAAERMGARLDGAVCIIQLCMFDVPDTAARVAKARVRGPVLSLEMCRCDVRAGFTLTLGWRATEINNRECDQRTSCTRPFPCVRNWSWLRRSRRSVRLVVESWSMSER